MQLIYDFIILVLYPLNAVLRLIPGCPNKIYFHTLFETAMLITGMHFFMIKEIRLPPVLLAVLALYIPLMLISANPVLFPLKKFVVALKQWPKMLFRKPVDSKNIFLRSIEEELVWRGAFANIAIAAGMPVEIIVFLGGILFYTIHINSKRKIEPMIEIEFLFFSFFIITVFVVTGSLLTVIIIHFIRNSFLLCYRESILVKEYH